MALPNEVNVGTAPNNGTGDPLRTGGQKINANFVYLDQNKIGLVEKGANNGVATLDSTGKLTSSQLPQIAITDVIVATENTIAAFAANSGNYTFQQGDVIIINDGSGNITHYLYVGGVKTDVNEYSQINGTEIEISQVNGLQAALDAKENEANKATDFTTQNNTLYPSVLSVVNYINAQGFITDYTVTESDVLTALGFTPENIANKAINFTTSNDTLYPTVKAVVDYIAAQGYITDYTVTEQDVIDALGFNPANDSDVVHKSGNETITGKKTFNDGSYFPLILDRNISTENVGILFSIQGVEKGYLSIFEDDLKWGMNPSSSSNYTIYHSGNLPAYLTNTARIYTAKQGTSLAPTTGTDYVNKTYADGLAPTETSQLTNDGEDGVNPFISETDLTDTPRLYTAQQGFDEFALTDAANITWDLDNQVARLLATSAVGNTRNLFISNSNPGVNYQLTYIQDATGGRELDLSGFDKVYGTIDLTADAESIVNVVVTNTGTSFVVITSDVSEYSLREEILIEGVTSGEVIDINRQTTRPVKYNIYAGSIATSPEITINANNLCKDIIISAFTDNDTPLIINNTTHPDGTDNKVINGGTVHLTEGGYGVFSMTGDLVKEYEVTASPDGTLWKTGQVDNSGNPVAPTAL